MDWERLDETAPKAEELVKAGDLALLPKSRKMEVIDLWKGYEIALRGASAFIDKDFKESLEKELKEQKIELKDWSPIAKTYKALVESIVKVITETTLTVLELDESVRLHICYEPIKKKEEEVKFVKPKPKEKKKTKIKTK
jgi:hypothetical protein